MFHGQLLGIALINENLIEQRFFRLSFSIDCCPRPWVENSTSVRQFFVNKILPRPVVIGLIFCFFSKLTQKIFSSGLATKLLPLSRKLLHFCELKNESLLFYLSLTHRDGLCASSRSDKRIKSTGSVP